MDQSFKRLMNAAGVDAAQLANRTSLTQSQIGDYLSGEAKAPDYVLNTLSLLGSFTLDKRENPEFLKQDSCGGTYGKYSGADFVDSIKRFDRVGRATEVFEQSGIRYFVNDFWTAKQRQSHSLHEISYRACFKGQLPGFFISRLTKQGETVLDPFMGRGTTLVEAFLQNRKCIGNDINPLSKMLVEPRLSPPGYAAIAKRLEEICINAETVTADDELLAFYHPDTLGRLYFLRDYFIERSATGQIDMVDKWIRMVCLNRLTGHSTGFFSVYTLPPNQATSIARQKRINEKRDQIPERKNVISIILKKTRSLLRNSLPHHQSEYKLCNEKAEKLCSIADNSVSLTVTSPPFLDVVDYAGDNWLRAWFAGFEIANTEITTPSSVDDWTDFTHKTLSELSRVTKSGGFIAYEVGEVRNGKVKLEEQVVQAAEGLPLRVHGVMINDQKFSKTANAWGVSNNKKGTNTNRIVLLERK